jgi:hypothetical protein
MVYMKQIECPICFEKARKYVRCFHQCRTNICKSCFKKMLQLDNNKDVSYTCPVCRQKSIRHRDNKFTRYCRAHLDVCESIIKIFENEKLSEEWELDQQMDFVSRLIELDISNMPIHIQDQYSN